MRLQLELQSSNYYKAADKLLIELALLKQSDSDSLSSLAAVLGINRNVLSQKLQRAGVYADFMQRYKTFSKRYNTATQEKAKRETERLQRMASYNEYLDASAASALEVAKAYIAPADLVMSLPIGVKNEITNR